MFEYRIVRRGKDRMREVIKIQTFRPWYGGPLKFQSLTCQDSEIVTL